MPAKTDEIDNNKAAVLSVNSAIEPYQKNIINYPNIWIVILSILAGAIIADLYMINFKKQQGKTFLISHPKN